MIPQTSSAVARARDAAILSAARTRQVSGASAAAISAFACLLLLAPALWNRYPLLQYDTGGYLARWYEGYLVPSRSTVFGIYLHFGEGLHFWPQAAMQCILTVWILSLVLRVFGVFRPGVLLAISAVLAVATTLPWLTSILLTDIFVGLSVLALHLLLFHSTALERWEKAGLFVLIAFAAATHSATLATLLAVLGAAAFASYKIVKGLVPTGRLLRSLAALAAGALMLLSANAALSGQFAWTPGGYGILFGRMLQDGIVTRFLKEHCPSPSYKLCPYARELPKTADEFLWGYSVFNDLGRFTGLGNEMRDIVLRSLAEYPLQQMSTAASATGRQLVMVATGAGVHDQLPHTYAIIERFIPDEVPAMRAARQQHGALNFDDLNLLHVPVALGSTLLLGILLLRLRRRPHDDIGLLAASVAVAILSNAFTCGALSGPHDRYGARMAWVATFVIALYAARVISKSWHFRFRPKSTG